MFLTEEEAKTKRCQESFGDGNVTPTGHMVAVHACGGAGYAIGTSPSMCIGSDCMAWRIGIKAIPPTYEHIERMPSHSIPDVTEGWERDGESFAHMPWKPGDGTPTFQRLRKVVAKGEPAKGYCGKAGYPRI